MLKFSVRRNRQAILQFVARKIIVQFHPETKREATSQSSAKKGEGKGEAFTPITHTTGPTRPTGGGGKGGGRERGDDTPPPRLAIQSQLLVVVSSKGSKSSQVRHSAHHNVKKTLVTIVNENRKLDNDLAFKLKCTKVN